jgi:hypothetical protein
MSYNQVLDNVLLRSMYFTTPANNTISSAYTLYGNGYGAAYFSNAVLPKDVSTLSTALGATDSNVASLSTQMSSLTTFVISSISSLYTITASTQQYTQDTSNALAAQIDAYYNSTITIVTSTLEGFSTYSSFNYQYIQLSTTAYNNFSTLSSYIVNQAAETYLASYTDALASTNTYIVSTFAYIDSNVSTISTIYVTRATLSTFSTIITTQLVSSSQGLTAAINAGNANTAIAIQTLSTNTGRSVSTLFSTTSGHSSELSNLEALSTGLYTTFLTFNSSTFSTSQGLQDAGNASTTSFYSSLIGSNTNEILVLSSFLYPYASTNAVTVSSLNSNLSTVTSQLSTLTWQFNLLQMSSILSSIYFSFYNLEIYTSSIISTTQGSYTQTLSTIEYSSYTQNLSVANSYFNYYVSTMYASTLSTLIPSTIAFTSSLMSTLYSTGYYLFESTIQSTILSTLYSTNIAYLNTIEPGILTHLTSTLATRQSFALSNATTTAVLDFSTFRNFNVSLQAPTDPYIYRITYGSNSLDGRDYQTGVITIDVSTIGYNYRTNSSALSLQTYHWGFPTYVSEDFIPYISNADYTMQYQYTILNQTLYTNLMNVYPRTNLTNLRLSTSGSNTVYSNGTPQSNTVWRNGSALVSWTPYAWFPPYGSKGPLYQPQVLVDVLYNGATYTSGPFPLQQSTGTVAIPPLSYTGNTPVPATMRAYVAGRMTAAATLSVGIVVPVARTLLLSNTASGTFIGGNFLQLYSDARAALFSPLGTTIAYTTASGNSNYGNTASNAASNLFTPSPNTNFIGPSASGPDIRAGATFSNIPAASISSIVYSTFTSGVSGIATSAMSQRQQLVLTTAGGYTRLFQLTASTITSFAL